MNEWGSLFIFSSSYQQTVIKCCFIADSNIRVHDAPCWRANIYHSASSSAKLSQHTLVSRLDFLFLYWMWFLIHFTSFWHVWLWIFKESAARKWKTLNVLLRKPVRYSVGVLPSSSVFHTQKYEFICQIGETIFNNICFCIFFTITQLVKLSWPETIKK